MDSLSALILGIVEGLTEFLPVSSTGHLILAGWAMKVQSSPGMVFEIVIQLGAILAVCVVYWRRFLHAALYFYRETTAWHFVRNLALAFIPAMVLGALLHDFIKAALFNPFVVAVALIVGGIAMILIERLKHSHSYQEVEDVPAKVAFGIGLIQTLALIPGVSRSGATILGALVLGTSRAAAAEFSFFLAVPTLAAASIYDLYKNWDTLDSGNFEMIGIGFLAAFVSALAVVRWMVGFVSRNGFAAFGWYRIGLGILVLILL